MSTVDWGVHVSEAEQRPRRRQARGERRVAQLLEAAASVFYESGYTAASTNAIAREAGVSPGTLYQFFPNKEAIAVELGGMLLQRLNEAHAMIFTPQTAMLPLREMLDEFVDPFIEFNCANPAFLALIMGPDTPHKVAHEHDVLNCQLLERMTSLLSLRAPHLGAEQCGRVAETAFAMFKAGSELVIAREGVERQLYIAELKAVLYGYLAPYVGTEAMEG
jgi:AcrR family transcriptional regulator